MNEPGALELLAIDERATVLVLMDGGLRATDTARLRFDVVTIGSDGAPYLRYWNSPRGGRPDLRPRGRSDRRPAVVGTRALPGL